MRGASSGRGYLVTFAALHRLGPSASKHLLSSARLEPSTSRHLF